MTFAWSPPIADGAVALPLDLMINVVRLVDGEITSFGPVAALTSSVRVGPLTLGENHGWVHMVFILLRFFS